MRPAEFRDPSLDHEHGPAGESKRRDPRAAWNAVERLAFVDLELARDLESVLLDRGVSSALRALAEEQGIAGGFALACQAAVYATSLDDAKPDGAGAVCRERARRGP